MFDLNITVLLSTKWIRYLSQPIDISNICRLERTGPSWYQSHSYVLEALFWDKLILSLPCAKIVVESHFSEIVLSFQNCASVYSGPQSEKKLGSSQFYFVNKALHSLVQRECQPRSSNGKCQEVFFNENIFLGPGTSSRHRHTKPEMKLNASQLLEWEIYQFYF